MTLIYTLATIYNIGYPLYLDDSMHRNARKPHCTPQRTPSDLLFRCLYAAYKDKKMLSPYSGRGIWLLARSRIKGLLQSWWRVLLDRWRGRKMLAKRKAQSFGGLGLTVCQDACPQSSRENVNASNRKSCPTTPRYVGSRAEKKS